MAGTELSIAITGAGGASDEALHCRLRLRLAAFNHRCFRPSAIAGLPAQQASQQTTCFFTVFFLDLFLRFTF